MRLWVFITLVVALLGGCVVSRAQNNGGRPNIPLSSASLPLDTVTNSWSAYSVARKLRTAYTGNALMAHKAGGATNNIGFVGDLVDTNAIATFAAGGVCYLAVLYDQSGNARNMSISPQWGDAGSALTNALALTDSSGNLLLDGDGHLHAMTNPLGFSYIKGIASSFLASTNISKFLVFEAFQHDDNYALFTGASLESGTIKQTTVTGNRKIMLYSNGDSCVDSDTYSLNTQYLVNTFDGDLVSTDDTIQLNDNTTYNCSNFSNNGGGTPTLGYDGGLTRTAGYYFSELFLFNVILTTERATLKDDINDFYTIW